MFLKEEVHRRLCAQRKSRRRTFIQKKVKNLITYMYTILSLINTDFSLEIQKILAEGDWETSDKSKKVNQGAPITKKNEAGEQKVASSSHISDKNIPHQHSQARLRGAQPDIVGDKGWSCKPKTVKSNKKKERKQHDNTKQKTEGTMKDLIDQDKPKSKSKLWRRFSLLGCN
ncbi:unnamed protein product [Meloidogyne enterolobii]|uniref:Uncharacterized protein n=1 Tax=Meloidogyne enterolobii TaxID=390850 RepID=A0ACB0YE10_MELEN